MREECCSCSHHFTSSDRAWARADRDRAVFGTVECPGMPPENVPAAVDCHVHVFSVGARSAEDARYRPAYTATIEAVRALWSSHRITHGVIVQPSFFGTDNVEMLAAVATDRERLRGVAVLDPGASDDDIARLDAAGVVALRLNLKGRADYAAYATGEWQALYRRAHA